jgi:hypothetical protein
VDDPESQELLRMMGDRPKIYVRARLRDGQLVVIEEVEAQDW